MSISILPLTVHQCEANAQVQTCRLDSSSTPSIIAISVSHEDVNLTEATSSSSLIKSDTLSDFKQLVESTPTFV